MKSSTEIRAEMQEQRHYLYPLLSKKSLILQQLKEVEKQIQKHTQTIKYLSAELQKHREE